VAVSWAGVRYPAHEIELEADAARAAAARAFAIAARAALVADAILASDGAVTHAVAAFAARGFAAAAAERRDFHSRAVLLSQPDEGAVLAWDLAMMAGVVSPCG
jgi:hypothetical protein